MNITERITKTVSEKVGNVKNATWEKVEDVNDQLNMQVRSQFINEIMKDENCSFQDAYDMCTPGTEKWQPKYSLGYKMAAPYIQFMLRSEKGKRAFKKDLLPEELELFEKEVEKIDFEAAQKEEMKKQKKAKKEAKKHGRKVAVGLDKFKSKKVKE